MSLLRKLGKRFTSVTVIGALTVVATTVLASPASAAVAYWKFRNDVTNECLTGGVNSGGSGKAFVTSCVIGSHTQQWDWLDDGDVYKRLKNRASGLCLMTDHKNSINAVWTSTCSSTKDGQRWHYGGGNGTGLISCSISGSLRTSPTAGAVYADDDIFNNRAQWAGWVSG